MKLLSILLVLFSSIAQAGYESGAIDQVMRVPHAGGRPQYGAVDLSKSAAVGTSILGLSNGGAENVNVGMSAAIVSSTMVVTLTQADGSSAPTSTNPVGISFRNATGTTGGYSQRQFTSATTVTLAATASLGNAAAAGATVYVYAINDTTSELCVSSFVFDDGSLQSATATPSTSAAAKIMFERISPIASG